MGFSPPKGAEAGPVSGSRGLCFTGFGDCKADESAASWRGKREGSSLVVAGAGILAGVEGLAGKGQDSADESEGGSAVGTEERWALGRRRLRGKGEAGGLGDEAAGLV